MNQSRFPGADISLAAFLLIVMVPLAALSQYAFFIAWFLPVPLSIFFVHQFRWISLWIALTIGIALVLGGFGLAGLVYAYGIYFFSYTMAQSIRNADSPYPVLIRGTLVFVLLFLVLLARLRWQGVHFYARISSQLAESSSATNPLFKIGAKNLGEMITMTIKQLQLVFPGMLCIISFILCAINFLLTRLLATSVRMKPPVLLLWNLPYGVIYVYIVSLSFVLFGWFHESLFWWHTFNSAVLVAGFFIGIQGLAFAWRRLHGRNNARLWMSLLLLATLLPMVRSVYILLGLFDSSNHTRKI